MTLDPARRAAAALVFAVTDEGRTLETAMASARSFQGLEGRDRAFARAIASATLRRLGGLDAVLGAFLQRPLGEGGQTARAILRTGAAQLLVLQTPSHAAVSQAVALAKAATSARPFSGLINAVLRRVDADGRALFAAQPPGADLPDWLFTRWCAALGRSTALAVAAAGRQEPPLDLTVKSDPAGWAERLGGEALQTGAVRLKGPGPGIPSLDGYAEGEWWVQDTAAALPARLLGDVGAKRVLDLCAAPGGKTLQLALAGAHVTALDKDPDRMARVRENLARTGLKAQTVTADALHWAPDAPFDAILLDAPCSATGTLRRRPDIAWLRRPSDIASLSDLQALLLARAAAWLRPGGRLVYAVCSIEPEEGPGVLPAGVAAGLCIDPLSQTELAGYPEAERTCEGVRTLPCHLSAHGGMDGFFAARLMRPA